MKKILPHISLIVLLVFAITSVLQYHHHDCDGRIYIHLTTLDDIVIGNGGNAIEHCRHNHKCESAHHHSHDGHDDDATCSMHLGEYKGSEMDCDATEVSPTTLLDWAIDNCEERSCTQQCITSVVNAEQSDADRAIYKNVGLLRAPPIA